MTVRTEESVTRSLTPGQKRTEKARLKRIRTADGRHATRMNARGWMCLPPEVVEALTDDLRMRLLAVAFESSTDDFAPPAT